MSRLAVVVPTLDTPAPLARLLTTIGDRADIFVVDDGSEPPLGVDAPAQLLRHPQNRGYGAAQKTGYAAALAGGAERIVLLHGDGQYPTDETLALADALDDADVVLGSRMLTDPAVIPTWRRLGNRALTGLANTRFHGRFTDLHTGARAFRASTLRALPLATFSDDFVFDQEVLVAALQTGLRVVERPVHTSYGGDTRSIPPRRAVRYAAGCVRLLLTPGAFTRTPSHRT